MESMTAEEFLKISADFRLGELDTEKPHPLTEKLSDLAKVDLEAAFRLLKKIDISALSRMRAATEQLEDLSRNIHDCLSSGGRIYLAGCGATGRLSLALESFGRQGMLPEEWRNRVIGFMAGGDAALIRSIEGFEDIPDYGVRQLKELGFGQNDLLIASTEGGETPWVIGVTEAAAHWSSRKPWFCYCNRDDVLRPLVERSRRVLENRGIEKICLATGPMALAGSTRMQASTVLMLGIGLALLQAAYPGQSSLTKSLNAFTAYFDTLAFESLAPVTLEEEKASRKGDQTHYSTDSFGLTVLTDTTERSPTFSLSPFENELSPSDKACLCYLKIKNTDHSEAAWGNILRRQPRCLEWENSVNFTGSKWLQGYPIHDTHGSSSALNIDIGFAGEHLEIISSTDIEIRFPSSIAFAQENPAAMLFDNVALKCLLNAHSTLLMGRLGRYEGNLMTYVRASNFKLIDRAIRYIQILAHRQTGETLTYKRTCEALFSVKDCIQPWEPIVLKTIKDLNL